MKVERSDFLWTFNISYFLAVLKGPQTFWDNFLLAMAETDLRQIWDLLIIYIVYKQCMWLIDPRLLDG